MGATYDNNALNQITDRVTPGNVTVSGFAPTGSTVTVNGQATTRQGDYFHAAAAVNNTAGAKHETINVVSTAPSSTVTRKVFVPKSSLPGADEKWTYDLDGNITRDDQWSYTWDAENRLVAMETRTDLIPGVVAAADARRLEFKYDYMGRRVEKLVRLWNSSATAYSTTANTTTRFIYDGWNLIAEYSVSGTTLTLGRSYTWGVDLSVTLRGGGGVGGLLMSKEASALSFYAYDGNGNVTAVIDRVSGGILAEYEYNAFGESLRASGAQANANPFRFSTKYADNESGLLYYGFRFYDARNGRFIGRDPIQESGGTNLYGFCLNNAINGYDYLGQQFENLAYYGARPSDWTDGQWAARVAAVQRDRAAYAEGFWMPPSGVNAETAVARDLGYAMAFSQGICYDVDGAFFARSAASYKVREQNAVLAEVQAGLTAGLAEKVAGYANAALSTAINQSVVQSGEATLAAAQSNLANLGALTVMQSNAIVSNLTASNASQFAAGIASSVLNASIATHQANIAALDSQIAALGSEIAALSASTNGNGASTPTGVAAPNSTTGAPTASGPMLFGSFTATMAGAGTAEGGAVAGGGAASGAGELARAAVRGGALGLALGAILATAGDSAAASRPNPQPVVRGGFATPESLIRGTTQTPFGLYGFSVQSAPGRTIDELARAGRFPNGTISVSTVDALRAVGAIVTPSPGVGYHATVVVPAPLSNAQAALISAAFATGIPNPYPVKRGGG